MKPLGVKGLVCEQGGCFTLPGYQDADGRQVAGLRTRGLFYPAGVSGRRWTPSGRTANKGVVLPCWVVMKPMGVKGPDCEQGGCFALPGCHETAGRQGMGVKGPDCEQGGCFALPGCHETAGRQGAGLRTRGLFCPAGLS